jgi:tyrosine-protein phosphatase YwqE
MLTLFKSKPTLKDLIPDNYVDIHSHLLPGIDDGAKTFEDTLELSTGLLNIGFSQFITTPHIYQNVWDNTEEQIEEVEMTTKLDLKKNGISIPFRAAAEYLLNDHFIKLCQAGEILPLKDKYVLVEISYTNPPIQLYSIIFDLRVAGYTPVLAHPERYVYYHYDFDEYLKLKKAGCYFQLNLLAVTGYYGEGITKIAEKLLQKGMYDFVGSDVHHANHIDGFNEKIKIKDLSSLKEIIANNQFFRLE